MKKVLLFSAVALMISAAVSCRQFDPMDSNLPGLGPQSFTCFTDVFTRATIGGDAMNEILWENGDQISFYQSADNSTGAAYSTTLGSPSRQADFTGSGAEAFNGQYIAFYPASQVVSWGAAGDGDARKLQFTIPTEQHPVVNNISKDYCPMIASASSATGALGFSHLAGYLSFTIPSDISVKEVVIESGDGSWLSGKVTLPLNNLTAEPEASETDSKVVFKNTDDSPLAAGTYYVAVRPRTWTGGIKLAFKDAAGGIAFVKYNATEPVIGKGTVQRLGTVRNLNFVHVGDIYKEGDTNKGIVIGVGDNYYTVMSLVTKKMAWATADFTPLAFPAFDKLDGEGNTAKIMEAINKDPADDFTLATFPPVEYCKALGDNWYLPAVTELINYFTALNLANTDALNAFNDLIDAAGGSKFTAANKILVWSSFQTASNKCQHIKYSSGNFVGSNAGYTKSDVHVRAFLKVYL